MVTVLHSQLDLVRDFVNTFDFETGIDEIATPDELAMWFSEQGLVDDLVEPTGQEVEDAHSVREAIRELLLANNGVEIDAAAASQTLEEAVGRRTSVSVSTAAAPSSLPRTTEPAGHSAASSRRWLNSRRPTTGSA